MSRRPQNHHIQVVFVGDVLDWLAVFFVLFLQVIFTEPGGGLPYITRHSFESSIIPVVEREFSTGFFEGCVFHAFFSAQSPLRELFAAEVC